MTVGRREFVLPLAFLVGAALFSSQSAVRAQQRSDRSHQLWTENLTPDQIKAALSKLSLGTDKDDPLHKMMREHLQKQFPKLPSEFLDSLIQRALKDPQFMEEAKRRALEKQTAPGLPPKFDQDDLAKLAKIMPRESDPKKLPKGVDVPDELKKPPQPDPGTAKTPPDGPTPPAKSDVIEPKEVVKPKGPAKGVDEPGPGTPPGGNPAAPPSPKAPEDNLFRPPDEPSDPRTKSLQAFAAVWERNIGPLDQTPEVKRALFDLVGGKNGLDLDLKDDKGNSVWDLLKKGDGSGLNFGDFMDGSGGNWKLPNMDFPSLKLGSWFGRTRPSGGSSSSSWNWGRSSPRTPGGPSVGGSGLGGFGLGGSWLPVVILGLVVLGILVWLVLKNLRTPPPQVAYTQDGLGPWPIDPRQINTREDVVKAFEYLSVLICGMAAKTWTHNTIADALSELAATHGETAVMLARLYELARYAPLDEPLSRVELMEARELVCGLAGVSY
jgi:hypothetical protein